MQKRGQIQFNWVFVIIAGAVILAFFINFTIKYIDLQNQKMGAEMARDLDNNLNSLSNNILTRKDEIALPLNADFEFNCNTNSFKINNFYNQYISNKIIFSSPKFKTRILKVWVNSWKYPFKIDNFFYISSDKIKYYLYPAPSAISAVLEIKGKIPDIFDVEILTSTSIPTDLSKYQEVRIISFNGNAPSWNFPNVKKIKIYLVNKKIDNLPYFGDEMMYGAIFSNEYPCLFEKIKEQFKEIIKIYSSKATGLWSSTSQQNCDYTSIKNKLNNLVRYLDNRDYDQIPSLITQIDSLNRDLDSKGCVTVY